MSVDIPNSVTYIDKMAFYDCSNMTSVTIPSSVTYIGGNAFDGCNGLNEVHITDIEAWCDIEFDANPLSYAHHLFLNNNEITDLVIPNSMTKIGNAFTGCTGLKSVIIPKTVTHIGWAAFENCSGLTSVIIPNTVTSIGWSAFSGCSSLTSIIIPNSVTSIGYGAFSGCSGLTNISIPNSVSTIGRNAFYGCSRLNNISIGCGIKTVENTSFAKSPDISDVYCYAEKVPYAAKDAFKESYVEYTTLHVPDTLLEDYKMTEPWNAFNIVAIDHIKGDANGDNNVDVVDISHIINHIKGQTPNGFSVLAADINNDGKVDAADITNQIDLLMKRELNDINSPETKAFSVTEALTVINALADGAKSESSFIVKGYIVGTLEYQFDGDGSLHDIVNFAISDEKDATVTLFVSRVKNYENANFDEETISSLKEGNLVEIRGVLQKYVKDGVTTPRLVNCYLISNSGI